LLVNNCNKAFKFSSELQRVKIGFDESNVSLDNWSFIFDPMLLRFNVMIHVACLEVVNVFLYHIFLEFVGRVLLGLRKIVIHLFKKWCEFSILEFDLNSILFNNFFSDINRSHFDCKMSVILLGESIVLRTNTSFYCDFFDFFSIFECDILRVVSIGAVSV
jgi:hypothetical protein